MVEVRFLGHSAFLLVDGEDRVLIDPFISDNPLATASVEKLDPTLILVTHAHDDHLGDAIELSKASGAPVLATFEVANFCEDQGASSIPAHMGGEIDFPFGPVKLFPAWHSSSYQGRALGNPCSFLVRMRGKGIFHAGDTCLFSDMRLIGEEGVDLALLPIGGGFTMGIDDAVRAARFLEAGAVVPMHYATFDFIDVDPKEFCRKVQESGIDCRVLGINEGYGL
ncbi:MAG: metal-dependent hydrolase [Methanomassiliicoccales archaeon]